MKLKRAFESKLLYSPGNKYLEDIRGFEELSNLIEDSLVGSGSSVESSIIRPHFDRNAIPNAVQFKIKRQLENVPYFSGNPYSRESFLLKDIIKKQGFFEECLEFIKNVNSAIYRIEKSGYIMNSYGIDQTAVYEKKVVSIKISYLVDVEKI